MAEQTPEEIHENLVELVMKAIIQKTNVVAITNHRYSILEGTVYEIDLIVLIDNKLCIFEIKTGIKKKKALKQLNMHKDCMDHLQNEMSAQGIFFSEIRTFWVSQKDGK